MNTVKSSLGKSKKPFYLLLDLLNQGPGVLKMF